MTTCLWVESARNTLHTLRRASTTFLWRKKVTTLLFGVGEEWARVSPTYFTGDGNVHCKKGLPFSRPQPGCHLPYSPWTGIIKSFPSRESMVSDIPAGVGKIVNPFLKCNERGGRAPPTLTAWANFTLMMECTPESSRCYTLCTLWNHLGIEDRSLGDFILALYEASRFFLSDRKEDSSNESVHLCYIWNLKGTIFWLFLICWEKRTVSLHGQVQLAMESVGDEQRPFII